MRTIMAKGTITLNIYRIFAAHLIIFLIFNTALFAGESGKIVGKITDKQTGEPMLGVNVILKGTTLGAATNAEGKYYIIGITPGVYELQASAVGYHKITITGIRIKIDLTTEINIVMESTSIETPTIIVTAEQKMVQKDITSTRKTVSRESMNELPGMESTSDIFKLQGGTFLSVQPQTLQLQDGTQLQVRDESVKDIHIRGGRGGEILFMVDGMPVTHPIYGGRSVFDLDVNAVEQVELLTGAFNAEYGQAQSGVVNITTRSGHETFTGGVEYRTDQLGIFGESYTTDYVSLFLGGPEPITRKLLPAIGINVPGKLNYFLALNGNITNTAYDNNRDRNKIKMFGMDITERQDNLANISAKINWDISSLFRTIFSFNGSNKDWTDFDWLWKNNPDNLPAYQRDNLNFNIAVNHVLSQDTYYSLNLGYLGVDFQGSLYNRNPSDFWRFYNNGISYDYEGWKSFSNDFQIVPDSLSTSIKAPQVDPLTGFYDSEGFNSIWRNDKTSTFTLKGDLTSQIHPEHLVKTGFELQYHDLSYIDIQHGGVQLSNYGEWAFRRDTAAPPPVSPPGPYKEFSQNRWVFHVYPLMGSAFIQDKFEKEFLIINAGLRMDWFTLGNTVNDPGWKKQWEDATGLKSDWKDFKYKISTRFGISFPITERTVVFFSYGHFFQLPEMQYFYRDPYSGGTTGNPHLDYERTILHEFGLTHQIFNDLSVDVKSYTKDISNQIGTTELKGNLGLPVQLFDNKSYGRARGLELELNKRYSNFLSGKLTYTVQWADVYSSSAFEEYIRSLNDFPYAIRERRAGWDIRHQIIFQGSVIAERGKYPEIFGLELFDDFNITVLFRFTTGQPYTPFTLDPAEAQKTENTATGPSLSMTDLKISKGFTLFGINLTAELDVFNLFNQNNIQIAYGFNTATGKPYRYGDVQPATNQYYDWYTMYRLMDPRQFSTGRYVKLGLRLSW